MSARCGVTSFWVSPDGAAIARCNGEAGLTFFDAESGLETGRFSLESPKSPEIDEAFARFFTFEPLRKYTIQNDAKHPRAGSMAASPIAAIGEGLVLRYVQPKVIAEDRSGRVVASRAYPAWKDDAFDDDGCHAPQNLQGLLQHAWGHRDLGVFFIDLVGASSFEACGWVSHVVRLPALAYVPAPSDE